MSALMTPTNEPAVTADTRFWLTSTLYLREVIFDHVGRFVRSRRFGAPTVIRVEVDEATYRVAFADSFGYGGDVTLPLDDYWWRNRCVWESPLRTFELWRDTVGHIDWWGS